jgi:enoyl-CoA hydratase/carnithine racemase
MSEDIILLEKKGKVATITFNRPDRMNAFNLDFGRGLIAALEDIAADRGIRTLILTGANEHFCSGADMHLLHEGTKSPERLIMMKELARIILAIRKLPQPIIAKVRGVAYGVGINLALSSDFVIAADTARFCEVFVQIGVMMDGGGTYFLPRLVGLVKARELALLGEEIDGTTAASIGLIYKSVPEDDLDEEVQLLAHKLSEKSLYSLAIIKESLESSFDMTLAQALEFEASHQSILLQTTEHKEAVEKFLRFRGKL